MERLLNRASFICLIKIGNDCISAVAERLQLFYESGYFKFIWLIFHWVSFFSVRVSHDLGISIRS